MIVKEIEYKYGGLVIAIYLSKPLYGQGYEFTKPKRYDENWKVTYNFIPTTEKDREYKIPNSDEVIEEFKKILKDHRLINKDIELILNSVPHL